MRTNAYIDASNLFHGGEKSLGWKIDYEKLYSYLKERYCVFRVFFFGGIEIHTFPFNYLTSETVPLTELEIYLSTFIEERSDFLLKPKLQLVEQQLNQVRFYLKLQEFGGELVLKPIKTYRNSGGVIKRKANCDVEMAFYIMRDIHTFERVIILSGDGDFLPILKYLKDTQQKEVLVLARGSRTAKEIKQFAGDTFTDFTENLRPFIERTEV